VVVVLVNGSVRMSVVYNACSGDKALDGRKTYEGNDVCSSCSIAADTGQPQWWELDLHGKRLIQTIIVTGRMGAYIIIRLPFFKVMYVL